MFRFDHTQILPLFLATGLTMSAFAKLAGVNYRTAERAIEGKAVSAPLANKIARALGIEPVDYLALPAIEEE